MYSDCIGSAYIWIIHSHTAISSPLFKCIKTGVSSVNKKSFLRVSWVEMPCSATTNSDLNRPCFAWHPYGKSGLFKTELVIDKKTICYVVAMRTPLGNKMVGDRKAAIQDISITDA